MLDRIAEFRKEQQQSFPALGVHNLMNMRSDGIEMLDQHFNQDLNLFFKNNLILLGSICRGQARDLEEIIHYHQHRSSLQVLFDEIQFTLE